MEQTTPNVERTDMSTPSDQDIKITVVYTPVEFLRAGERLMTIKKQEQEARSRSLVKVGRLVR